MVPGVFVDPRALAKTLFGHAEELPVAAADSHPDDDIPLLQPDPDDPAGGAPHVAHVRLRETHRLSLARRQQNVVRAVGELAADQLVVFGNGNRDDPRIARVRKLGQGRFLDDPVAGGHYDILVGIETLYGDDVRDLLPRQHVHQIDDCLPLPGRSDIRYFVHLDPVNLSSIREDQQVAVSRGDEDVVDEILFARGHTNPAFASASLRPVEGGVGALDISRVRYRNDHILFGNQVFQCDLDFLVNNLGPARIPIVLLNLLQLLHDDSFEDFFAGQDLLEAGDQLQGFIVFVGKFLALQARQALQTHFQDRLRLGFAELKLSHQPFPGHGRFLGSPDQSDDGVQHVQSSLQPFQDVGPRLRLLQVEEGPLSNNLLPVVNKAFDGLFQRKDSRLVIDNCQKDDAEARLHRGQLVQVVHHHLRRLILLELDDDTHPVAVRLISDVGDAVQPLVPHKLRNALDEFRLVDLER